VQRGQAFVVSDEGHFSMTQRMQVLHRLLDGSLPIGRDVNGVGVARPTS
jgi:hypothetical protein